MALASLTKKFFKFFFATVKCVMRNPIFDCIPALILGLYSRIRCCFSDVLLIISQMENVTIQKAQRRFLSFAMEELHVTSALQIQYLEIRAIT